ncbi:hypothetical protein B0H14DRAFT_2619489 [Mycena olivaceomarginata]|nr:hypothetical protein B0H14DRAFT_2619489 [Mycena olivaceomarginata]
MLTNLEGLVLEAASDESSREPLHTAEGDVKHSWATYMPHWPCYRKLTTFDWDGGLTQDIAAFLSRHRTHQDGVSKSLVPNVRKLSIEANDLPNLVPGRAVDTLNIWGSWSGPFVPNGSILMTVQILSGTKIEFLGGFPSGVKEVMQSSTGEFTPIAHRTDSCAACYKSKGWTPGTYLRAVDPRDSRLCRRRRQFRCANFGVPISTRSQPFMSEFGRRMIPIEGTHPLNISRRRQPGRSLPALPPPPNSTFFVHAARTIPKGIATHVTHVSPCPTFFQCIDREGAGGGWKRAGWHWKKVGHGAGEEKGMVVVKDKEAFHSS